MTRNTAVAIRVLRAPTQLGQQLRGTHPTISRTLRRMKINLTKTP